MNSKWKSMKVSEFAEVIGGGTPDTKNDQYWNGSIPWVAPSDLTGYNSVYISYGAKNISEAGLSSSSTKLIPENSVLLSSRAPIGYVALAANPICTNQGFRSLVCKKDKIDPLFLYYALKVYKPTLEAYATGATFPELSGSALKKIEFPVPPVQEQIEISKILYSYDQLIENNTKRIAILEQMAEQIYKEWFVRMRFTGYENTKFIKGFPEGWEVKPLSSVCKDILDKRGVTPEKLGGNWQEDGVSALSALNVKNGKLIKLDDCKKISEALYLKWMKKELRKNDLLMTSEAPLGEVCILNSDEKYVLSQRLYGIRPNPKLISPFYLYQYIKGPVGQGAIQARATGSTVGGIRQSLLKQVEIVVPKKQIQDSYDEIVEQIEEEIAILRKSITNSIETRNLLLPRLISGKLSVEHITSKLQETV